MASHAGSATTARALGARIRSIRGEAAITQERLAWDCDLDKGYLSQVEAGKRLPSLAVLGALAKRLEVELADLVGFDLRRPRLLLLDAARRADDAAIEAALAALRETVRTEAEPLAAAETTSLPERARPRHATAKAPR